MPKHRLIVFLVFVLGSYTMFNAFVFGYGWDALSAFPAIRPFYAITFWIAASLFVVARITERYFKGPFVRGLLWVGSFWLAMLTYLVLSVAGISLLLILAEYVSPQLLSWYSSNAPSAASVVFLGSFALSVLGWKNARHPVVRKLEYVLPKGKGKSESFHVIAATDIHLGTLIGKKRFDRLVNQINRHQPDAVFFVGDTIDEDIEPVIRQDIGTSIRSIRTRLGVFAVNGNHEHIGGVEIADAYLAEHGVRVLRDESLVLDEAFTLVGREDISSASFWLARRKSLSALLENVDVSLPIILLDHQPSAIPETAKDGRVALQLSGHTHHGQLWPFSLITKGIFEISWGGRKIGNTYFYVSSGWGTWGPPVRTGNSPELLDIRIRFE